MSAATLFGDEAITLAKVAPMLERIQDSTTRQRLAKLDQMLTTMEQQGYEIGTPRKVRRQTEHTHAEWHIPIAHNGNRCALSFFVNETPEPIHETRKAKA